MIGGKLAQADGVMTKMAHPILTRIWTPLKEVGNVVSQTEGQGDEEEVKKELWEAFVVIFAAVSSPSQTTFSLLVSWPEMKSQQASLALTQEAS
jgi:hypothetical protein